MDDSRMTSLKNSMQLCTSSHYSNVKIHLSRLWARVCPRQQRWRLLLGILFTSLCVLLVIRQAVHTPEWDNTGYSLGLQEENDTLSTDEFMLQCGWTAAKFSQPFRTIAYLRCGDSTFLHKNYHTASIAFHEVRNDTEPPVTSLNDTACLQRVIQSRCSHPALRVPRVVHYIQFGAKAMTLENFISVLSVRRFVRPCLILIHGDAIPRGMYWQALLNLVNNIVHVRYTKPTQIFGRTITHPAHSADVARLRILSKFGGMYVDNDQFVLRSLDTLYNESMVIGTEVPKFNCGNGFLVAAPGARFLRLWLSNYTDFDGSKWAVHSTVRPYHLSLDYPRLVKVVDTFFKPNYGQVRAFFNRTQTPSYNWTTHYGFHLYHNRVKDLFNKQRIDLQDNVVGDAIRYILYGDMKKCLKKVTKNYG